jgi:hypothetical protein
MDVPGPKVARVLLGALLAMAAAKAQAGRAELYGGITDPSGLPVVNAIVTAINEATAAESKTTTASNGDYHFFALPPGNYTLKVARPGFVTLRRTGVELRVGDLVELNLRLQIGEVAEFVDVHAAAPMLETTTGTESFVAAEKQVSSLPLDGRNFVPLIALAPGVALPPGSTSSPSLLPRINGRRPRTSEYIYDGVSVLQPEPGQVAYFPILDSIQEFRVQLNSYSAEYGRSNGGIIQVASKSGSNQFHGTLFEYLRNEALNARNFFARPGALPPFKRNQYGFVLGGPVQKNKTFFFTDWQGTRLRIGNTRISSVPTSSARQGVFSAVIDDPATTRQNSSGAWIRDPFPGNSVPLARFDTTAASLLSHYPLPNVFAANGAELSANNFSRTAIDWTDQDQFDTRLDRYFGERHRLFGRYTWLRDESAPGTPLPDGSRSISSGVIGDTLTRADSIAVDDTFTASPSAVNQLRFGFSRRGFGRTPESALPIYQVAGFQQLGPPESATSQFTTSVTQLIDTWSMVKASHSLKFGTDLRFERLDVRQPPDPSGLFTFSNVLTAALNASGSPTTNTGNAFASFLLGQVSTFNIDVQPRTLKPRASIAEFFVQDDWKAARRLSLSLGVRYTLNFPSTEANNRGAIFNLNTEQLDFLGQNGMPRSARKLDWGDFGPRVSLAYQVADSFVVRSGYGLVWIEQAGITTPFTVPFFPFIQSVGQRSQDNLHPAFVLAGGPSVVITQPNPDSGLGQGVFGVDRQTGSGYAQQWNFSLERTIGKDWVVDAPRGDGYQPEPTARGHPGDGIGTHRAGDESVLRTDSGVVFARRPHARLAATAAPVPAIHYRQPVPEQHREFDVSRASGPRGEAIFGGADADGGVHVFEAHRRCVVRLRRGDSHRARGQFPGGRQLQSQARKGPVERRHSACVFGGLRVRSAFPAAPDYARVESWRDHPPSVRNAPRGDADHEFQLVRRVRDPASESHCGSGARFQPAVSCALVQYGGVRSGASVHDRQQLAESGSGAGLRGCGPDAVTYVCGDGAGEPGTSGGDFQCLEYAFIRTTERSGGKCGFREYYECLRSARGGIRAARRFLTNAGCEPAPRCW